MKRKVLFTIFALMAVCRTYAYDIAVENEDGVTICYNYINDGTELEVCYSYSYKEQPIIKIPEEVTYKTKTRKVTSIGEEAFYYSPNSHANKLSEITIPKSVTTIKLDAFRECWNLTKVHITDLVAWCNIKFYEYGGRVSNPLYYAQHLYLNGVEIKKLVVPNSVTSIGAYTFYGCKGLTSVTIHNSVTTIEKCAFYYCSKLTRVNISDLASWCNISNHSNPLEYAHHLYLNGQEVKDLVIPNSVTTIGERAFSDCSGLTSVTIPNSVTTIGRAAFEVCTGLTSVVSKMVSPCKINEDCFPKDVFYNTTLYVPKGTKDAYKSTDYWSKFVFIEEGDPSGETPEPQKCSKPTIGYKKGQLTFSCATSGATCYYSISDSDIKSGSGNKVDLTVTYQVSVYASKAGYDNSETAHATLCWIDVDPKTDGITNGVAQVKALPVLIQAQDGFINITGMNEGQHIAVYQADGKQVASANAYDGTANIVTNLSSGTVAIVKVGDKAIKVIMK